MQGSRPAAAPSDAPALPAHVTALSDVTHTGAAVDALWSAGPQDIRLRPWRHS